MKLWQVFFHGNRPPIIVFGKTASRVKRDMRDMFGHDKIDEVEPISREDAENEYGDEYENQAKIYSVVKEDLIPQWLRRAIMKPKMKKLVLAYLRWRRDNPGQGRKGVQHVVKLMGLSPQDGNQLVDTLNDMVKKGEMPKHLALEDQEQMTETTSILTGNNPFYITENKVLKALKDMVKRMEKKPDHFEDFYDDVMPEFEDHVLPIIQKYPNDAKKIKSRQLQDALDGDYPGPDSLLDEVEEVIDAL
mgnify:FL=1